MAIRLTEQQQHALDTTDAEPPQVVDPRTNAAYVKQDDFPSGWNEERVRRVLAHYEAQTEAEAVAEDEVAFEDRSQTIMEIPEALPLTNSQRQELDRRLDELEAEGPTGLSWDEVVAQSRARAQ